MVRVLTLKARTPDPHPRWLEPEVAKLLDENGFRRNAQADAYFGPAGARITETQLLARDLESLRKLVARATRRAEQRQ